MINISELKEGDIVINIATGNAYIIVAELDNMAIGVRTVIITNPHEWELHPR